MNKNLELGNLPFYWRTTNGGSLLPNPVNDVYPFGFEVAPNDLYIRQVPNHDVSQALDIVYQYDENVGYLQDGMAQVNTYGTDFLNYTLSYLKPLDESMNRLFEVGSGGGWLLKKLAEDGWTCTSCDPSPTAKRVAELNNFAHLSDFYGPNNEYPLVDVIVHYTVIEHIEDPIQFLAMHTKHLKPGGLVIFGTPDCTQQFEVGDVSMAIHEHRSYFSIETVEAVIRASGLTPVNIKAGNVGGVLHCVAKWTGEPSFEDDSSLEALREKNFAWIDKARNRIDRVQSHISDAMETGEPIALYIPLRGLTYCGGLFEQMNLVLIDDDPNFLGRYFDGIDAPVHNSSVLDIENFCLILAMTTSYEQQVVKKIQSSLLNYRTSVITPYSLL